MQRHTLCRISCRASRRASRRGATLVEFAAIVPVLMLMLLGIMEFGWYARTQLIIANAAREGARSASIGKTTTQITTRVINGAAPVRVTTSDISLQQSGSSGATYEDFPADDTTRTPPQNDVEPGRLIRVTVSVVYRRLVGLPITPSRITARVVMVRERT